VFHLVTRHQRTIQDHELEATRVLHVATTVAHGHRVRHAEEHWCYECVRKIQSNNCGFDINYHQQELQKARLLPLWNGRSAVGAWDECWEAALAGSQAHALSFVPQQLQQQLGPTDNVTVHKAIYQCAWGDVGKMFVTRTCKNKSLSQPSPSSLKLESRRFHPRLCIRSVLSSIQPSRCKLHRTN
jgi:hypothetical protein